MDPRGRNWHQGDELGDCDGNSWGTGAIRNNEDGTSLAGQGLGLQASTAGGVGSTPGQGTKIPHILWHGQKINKQKY